MVYFTDRIRECAQEMAMMAVRVSDDGRSLPLAVSSKPRQHLAFIAQVLRPKFRLNFTPYETESQR